MSELQMRALRLYRDLYRAAARMPTPNRRDYIRQKIRLEFRIHRLEENPEQIEFLLRFGESQLENVLVQAHHLEEIYKDPNMHAT